MLSKLAGTLRPSGQQQGKTTSTMVKVCTLAPPDIIISQRHRGSYTLQMTYIIELYVYVFEILKTWPNQELFKKRGKISGVEPLFKDVNYLSLIGIRVGGFFIHFSM